MKTPHHQIVVLFEGGKRCHLHVFAHVCLARSLDTQQGMPGGDGQISQITTAQLQGRELSAPIGFKASERSHNLGFCATQEYSTFGCYRCSSRKIERANRMAASGAVVPYLASNFSSNLCDSLAQREQAANSCCVVCGGWRTSPKDSWQAVHLTNLPTMYGGSG